MCTPYEMDQWFGETEMGRGVDLQVGDLYRDYLDRGGYLTIAEFRHAVKPYTALVMDVPVPKSGGRLVRLLTHTEARRKAADPFAYRYVGEEGESVNYGV